jgi:cation diffusion facilitator CzcD-associated flavoprotein CzcO
MSWKGLSGNEAKIAVLGAGAAGIASYIALRQAGFENITVFEATSNIGGTWVYTPETENAHSSMYKSLRVNIPKQAMCFLDTPFRDDIPSFPGHADVARYLQNVAEDKQMSSCIRFNSRVACVSPQDPNNFYTGWIVQTYVGKDEWNPKSLSVHDSGNGQTSRGKLDLSDPEFFHAVFVCCGHYSGTFRQG